MSTTKELLRRERMDTTIGVLVDLFAATKETEGKSAKTVSWYKQMLGRFVQWVGPNTPLRDLTIDKARAFIASLQAQEGRWNNHPNRPSAIGKLSPVTIHTHVRALKAFSSWLVDDRFSSANLFQRIKLPKTPSTMIEVLTDEEIASLFSCMNPNCSQGATAQLPERTKSGILLEGG